MPGEPITIIGAGMGGLTAALACQRVGLKVSIYEQAPALTEVGAGFTVGPNAMRGLDYAGVGPSVRKQGTLVTENTVRHWQTNEIIDHGRLGTYDDKTSGINDVYYHLHRADVQSILADAVRANDPDCVKLGHQFADLEQRDGQVVARFKNGATIETHVLIGGDGARSAVRHAAFGGAPTTFGGSVAYRGLVPIKDLDPAIIRPGAQLSIGPGQMFMRYPIRNGTLLNFVANVTTSVWQEDGWNTPSDIAEVIGQSS